MTSTLRTCCSLHPVRRFSHSQSRAVLGGGGGGVSHRQQSSWQSILPLHSGWERPFPVSTGNWAALPLSPCHHQPNQTQSNLRIPGPLNPRPLKFTTRQPIRLLTTLKCSAHDFQRLPRSLVSPGLRPSCRPSHTATSQSGSVVTHLAGYTRRKRSNCENTITP